MGQFFNCKFYSQCKVRDLLDWHSVTTMDEQLYKITKHEKNI
jgi:hypothetical protein